MIELADNKRLSVAFAIFSAGTILKMRGLLLAGALALIPSAGFGALSFDGVKQYVTFGPAPRLGSPTFTVETWFNWTGGGVPAKNSGLLIVPLVSKMSAEFDGDNRDGNYLLGIRMPGRVLAADMEEGVGKGTTPGANHPVAGVTTITTNTWHHAAVTYNGTNWMLYLDGNLEATLTVGRAPRFDSIQHAGLGTSLDSHGTPTGFFSGMLDEVRIWSYARSTLEIASNRNAQVWVAPGLLGCWPLMETGGLIAHDSSGGGVDGALRNEPDWVKGERAVEDVLTPIRFTAVDPVRTALLREVEGKRIPPLFRVDPRAADEVEKSFFTNYLLTRERFLAALEETFPRHGTNPPVTAHPKFRDFLVRFAAGNEKGFPFTTNVAFRWAEGHRERGTLTNMVLKLRDGMSRFYIIPQSLPQAALDGGPQVRIVASNNGKEKPSIETVENQSLIWPRTNLFTLAQAKAAYQQRFPTNDQVLASYLAGFLKENCFFDAELTRQVRERHSESIFANDQYEAGQFIVKKGQMLDPRLKAALAELKTQVALEENKMRTAVEQAKAENALREMKQKSEMSEFKSRHFGQQNRWLLGGLIAVAITSSIAVWQVARARRAQNLLPAPVYSGGDGSRDGSGVQPDGVDDRHWRERALTAERRAAQSNEVVRNGLLPHLAFWLKTKLVRGLMSERSHLMRIQQMAERELAELDKRLADLQAPLQERLRCYEQRIVELESQLEVKGHENRELIRAKIESTRRKLEAAQARGGAWM